MARRPTKDKDRGDGGVYQDGDGWRAIVHIDGRQVKRRAPTWEAAEALRKELIAQRDAGLDVGSAQQTLEAWLETWHDLKSRTLSPRSQLNNRRLIDGYLVPLVGGLTLGKVKAEHLQTALHRVQDDIVASSGGRHSGGRTVQALAQLLDAALGLAVRRRILQHNPMDGVEVPEYTAKVKEALDDAHLAAWLAVADQHSLGPLWQLYAHLGLRRGEGLGLRWADLDLDAGTVHVRQQVQELDGKLVFGPPKNNAVRLLPLPGHLIAPLGALRRSQRELRVKRADTWVDHDLVFCSRDGKPLWPANLDSDFVALIERAGLSRAHTLHSLRHTVATLLDECGASEALKAGILGHNRQKTVTQRYTHARVAAMRKVLDAVAVRIDDAAVKLRRETQG